MSAANIAFEHAPRRKADQRQPRVLAHPNLLPNTGARFAARLDVMLGVFGLYSNQEPSPLGTMARQNP
jgi:hypothetical protein